MVKDKRLVVGRFNEFTQIEKNIYQSWEQFISKGQIPDSIRPTIVSSWERCKQDGINLNIKQVPIVYQGNALADKREQNQLLLDYASPYLQEICSVDFDLVWYLTDRDGIILERMGGSGIRNKTEQHCIVQGGDISEQSVGTNAAGVALIEKKPVQVFSSEHFNQIFHCYVASASPIHDPLSKEVLGALLMGSEKHVVPAHDIFLVQQQVKKIEELIGSKILEQNTHIFEFMFNLIQEPVIFFDWQGTIVRYNGAAKQLLHVQIGVSITKMIGISNNVHQFKEMLSNGMQDIFRDRDGVEWKFELKPYKRNSHIVGGIALFHKVSFSLPRSRQQKETRYQFSDIVTQDSSTLRVIQLAKKAAFSDKTLLITGETGTGKELLSQSIHSYGSRRHGPFIEVNCGAIPRELVASELFGYEGGSFTGAKSQGKKGKFLLADQGTIFLDEIGDLPLEVQVYMLRVLEERTVIPVGGSQAIPINVRVIAATHKNLMLEVKKGNFREDLYHRLNVISLTIPSLRERKGDIPLLVHYFLNHSRDGNAMPVMDQEVMEALCSYSWPGNVRQLRNVIEKMVFHADDAHIQLKDLPSEIQADIPDFTVWEAKADEYKNDINGAVFRRKKIDERTLIQALKQSNGNITQAARILNISRWTVYNKMKEFNLK